MAFRDVLKTLRLGKGLTQEDVAKGTQLSKSVISMYETGSRKPSFEALEAIADFFNVDMNTLTDTRPSPASSDRPRRKGVRIPVLGSVVAGVPIEAVEEIIDYEEIDEDLARTGDFFALQIRGASMEPVLYEGDIVIVRKQPTAENGDTAIVLINGDEATVKKIKRETSGIMLIGNNTAVYEPHFYSNEEIENLPVQILGKVIELRRKL